MTLDYMANSVMSRLNLTSDTARARIEDSLNDANRALTSSLGLITSRHVVNEVEYDPDTYLTLPYITVTGMEKILRIQLLLPDSRPRRLDERSFDDITDLTTFTAPSAYPTAWAPQLHGSGSVTFVIDDYPDEPFTLSIDGYDTYTELEGDDEPTWPASFHDVLIEGVIADELLKMEKDKLAAIADGKYQQRLSDLRFFLAKSAYNVVQQGAQTYGTWPLRRWRSVQ